MDDLKKLVFEDYQEAVRLAPVSEELKRALKTHERAPLFLQNLLAALRKSPKVWKRETIKLAVADMTNLFLSQVEQQAKERHMSEIAKQAIRTEAEKKQEMREIADSVLSQEVEHVEETQAGQISRSTLEV